MSTSPWNIDPFLWKDAGSVLGFEHLLSDTTDSSLVQEDFDTPDILRGLESPPPSVSDQILQAEPYFADMLLDFDAVDDETSVASVLDLGELSLDLAADSDWSSSAFSTCDDDPWIGMQRPPRPVRAPDLFTGPSSKSWLMMSGEEQLRTVETLTEVISRRLDLREQVEVIRIIDPRAVLQPSDREFVIDLKHLNDQKLREIADYVRRHAADWDRLDDHDGSSASSATSSGRRRALHGGGRQRISGSAASSVASETSSSSSGPSFSKRQTQRRRRQQTKTWRQRKARQQLQKERRSGLFVNEQVLSISDCSTGPFGNEEEKWERDEEEEVDILH